MRRWRARRGKRGGSVRARLLQLEIDVAQFVERAVSADLGGTDGAFEDAGDFGERELLETGEEEDFAVVAIEAGEGGVEEGVIVARRGAIAGIRGLVGVVLQIGGVGRVGRGVGFAEMVGGAAAGEVIHPGRETAVVAIGVAVFEHPLEDGLGDVFGGGAVAGEFHEETEEGAMVALEEFAERVEFAVADGEHQGVIGAWFGGGVHREGAAVNFNHGW